jgi:electron transport complex protein RnfD
MTGYDVLLYQSPQINLARPAAARMWLVSLCAGLAIIQSALGDSFSSLLTAFALLSSAFIMEFLLYFRTEKGAMIRDGSCIASALVLTLLLPNELPVGYAVSGMIFAIVVIKFSYGGLGANWMNPAIGAWLFIRFSWPTAFDKAMEASALTALSRTGVIPDAIGSGNSGMVTLLNERFFSLIGSRLPEQYAALFNSASPGLITDRGMFGLVLGTIFIAASQASRIWVPAAFLGIYAVLVKSFGALPFGGEFGTGDLFAGLFSGGTVAAAFLLLSDPVTSPKSDRGALVMALFGGLLTFVFRYLGSQMYGAFFAIALLNPLALVLRYLENRIRYEQHRPRGKEAGNKRPPEVLNRHEHTDLAESEEEQP